MIAEIAAAARVRFWPFSTYRRVACLVVIGGIAAAPAGNLAIDPS